MKTYLSVVYLALSVSTTSADNLRKLAGGTAGGSLSGCFSERATVLVDGKGPVEMKHLQLGDRILSGSGAYEPIYTFGHLDKTYEAKFLQIQTAGTELPLEMTAEHMVFLHGKTTPVRADSVQVGSVLQGLDAARIITKIETVTRTGLYAPLTPSGSLVVDGILASAYISLQDAGVDSVVLGGGIVTPLSQQSLVHVGLSPLRVLCMGISGEFCKSSHDHSGMQNYVALGIQFAKVGESWPVVLQILVLLAVLVVSGVCFSVESLFGASLAPAVVLALAGTYGLAKRFDVSIRANKIKSI